MLHLFDALGVSLALVGSRSEHTRIRHPDCHVDAALVGEDTVVTSIATPQGRRDDTAAAPAVRTVIRLYRAPNGEGRESE